MPRDEVDDTDMTPAAFRAAAASGTPVRVVRSRAEFEAAIDPDNARSSGHYYLNRYLALADAGTAAGDNLPAAARPRR